MPLGLQCFAESIFSPKDSLNGVGGGESRCALLGKWFQELELACISRVLEETKGRWGDAWVARRGEGGKESIKARMLQRVPLVARSSESGKRMYHQGRKSLT